MGTRFPKFRAAAVQAAPVFLDREGTVEKTCELIREAGKNGADLVAFPEAFIPSYPYWVWLDSPLKGFDYFVRLYKNSVEVPSAATDSLCQAAREAGTYVVVGINEIDPVLIGTIYNTNLYIDRNGHLIGKHRKLVPTFAEKTVWGYGDGSTLRVYETEIGRLGSLCCGENTNTLARFALLAQGEQVHVANYPAFPVKERWDMESAIKLRAGAHALEGKVFVVVSSSSISDEMKAELCDTPEKLKWMEGTGSAVSAIYGPDGNCIGEPLIDQEGIVYADIDLEMSIAPKLFQDITGHYNRFDVLGLYLNREANRPIRDPWDLRRVGALEGADPMASLRSTLIEDIRADVKALVKEALREEMAGKET